MIKIESTQIPTVMAQRFERIKLMDKQYMKKQSKNLKAKKRVEEAEKLLNYKEEPKKEKEPEVPKQVRKYWDVPIGEPIEFFDPTLSYEITGYRPLTETEGLDFDPKAFTKAADSYRVNGRYTMYAPGTFKNRLFWLLEWERCRNGYTVGKYRLTGPNYFWLNYYRLLSNISSLNEDDDTRVEDFPGFMAKQYEYFHYLELCKVLKKDGLVFKARGVNKLALF